MHGEVGPEYLAKSSFSLQSEVAGRIIPIAPAFRPLLSQKCRQLGEPVLLP